jgi:NADH-quinone oxidoreductase subunit N
MAAAAKAGGGDVDDWAGLSRYAPGVAAAVGLFFFSLAGIPPLAGWFAKFVMFRAVLGVSSAWAVTLAVIAAVNAVIALYYYARVVKTVYIDQIPVTAPVDEAARTPVAAPLALALGLTAAVVVAAGFFPQILAFFGDAARALAIGP